MIDDLPGDILGLTSQKRPAMGVLGRPPSPQGLGIMKVSQKTEEARLYTRVAISSHRSFEVDRLLGQYCRVQRLALWQGD